MALELTFAAEVWQYDEPAGWHFLTLPGDSFVLPVKAEVRRREDVLAGDVVEVRLRLEP